MDIQEIVAGIGSSDALGEAASKAGVDPGQAQGILQGVLEHVTGGGDIEGMAEAVAGKVGVDPSQVQQFLPSVMGLLQGHAENANEGVQGMLGGLIGSMQGSPFATMLSGASNEGGSGVADDVAGLAKGFFSR